VLFAGYNYCPQGGMNDFIGSYDTMVQAIESLTDRDEWFNVLDTETGRIYDHYEARAHCSGIIAWAYEIDEHSEQTWNDTVSF